MTHSFRVWPPPLFAIDRVSINKFLVSRMVHRGACGADNDTGDGAGALVGIPHPFYKQIVRYQTNCISF